MAKFLVIYDLRDENGDTSGYEKIYKVLEPFGGRLMGQRSVWEIEHTEHTVSTLVNTLGDHLDDNDLLYVVDITGAESDSYSPSS